MKRDLGHRTPDTPQARKKQRIGGGLLMAGICFNFVATVLPAGQRNLTIALLSIGWAFLLAAILYYMLARRSA